MQYYVGQYKGEEQALHAEQLGQSHYFTTGYTKKQRKKSSQISNKKGYEKRNKKTKNSTLTLTHTHPHTHAHSLSLTHSLSPDILKQEKFATSWAPSSALNELCASTVLRIHCIRMDDAASSSWLGRDAQLTDCCCEDWFADLKRWLFFGCFFFLFDFFDGLALGSVTLWPAWGTDITSRGNRCLGDLPVGQMMRRRFVFSFLSRATKCKAVRPFHISKFCVWLIWRTGGVVGIASKPLCRSSRSVSLVFV